MFTTQGLEMEFATFLLFILLLVLIILMLVVGNLSRGNEKKVIFMVTLTINTILVMSAYYIIVGQTEGILNFIFYLLTAFLIVKTIGDYMISKNFSTPKRESD
jgi:hypothetical protein